MEQSKIKQETAKNTKDKKHNVFETCSFLTESGRPCNREPLKNFPGKVCKIHSRNITKGQYNGPFCIIENEKVSAKLKFKLT